MRDIIKNIIRLQVRSSGIIFTLVAVWSPWIHDTAIIFLATWWVRRMYCVH